MLKKQIVILMFVITGATAAAAQSLSPTVLSSSGGSGSADNVSLSWTAGELITQNFSSDTLLLTQGFQQGKITVTTAVNELNGLNMDVKVYPNPVRNVLNVNFQGMIDQTVRLKLMNLKGKVVMSREIHDPSSISRLNINEATPGAYMLEVNVNGKSKTFKIVKQ
jgi:hypothetical protein